MITPKGGAKMAQRGLLESPSFLAWVAIAFAFLGLTTAIGSLIFLQSQVDALALRQEKNGEELIRMEHVDAREMVRVQIGLEMTKRFDSPEMRRNRRALAKAFIHHPASVASTDWRVFDFFETLAEYRAQHRIDEETVRTNFYYYLVYYWTLGESEIKEYRKEENDPNLYRDFENLTEELMRSEAKYRDIPVDRLRPNTARVSAFLKDEMTLM